MTKSVVTSDPDYCYACNMPAAQCRCQEADAMVVNERGGKQGKLDVRCDLLPVKAVLAVARTLAIGEKSHGKDSWKLIGKDDHLNHALAHLFCHLNGDRDEDHLTNAACRVLFAVELEATK